MKIMDLASHLLNLVPWYEPLQDVYAAGLCVVEVNLGDLTVAELCWLARIMSRAKRRDVKTMNYLLDNILRNRSMLQPCDVAFVGQSLFSLVPPGDEVAVGRVCELLSSVLPLDLAVIGGPGMQSLSFSVKEIEALPFEVSGHGELVSELLQAATKSVALVFQESWMLDTLINCSGLFDRSPSDASALQSALAHVLPTDISALSHHHLSVIAQVLAQQCGDVTTCTGHRLQPHVYTSIVQHITQSIHIMPVDRLLAFLRFLKRCKMLDYRLVTFVAQMSYPSLGRFTTQDLVDLLGLLEWTGADTGLQEVESAMRWSGNNTRLAPWLPISSVSARELARAIRHLIVPHCRARREQFSAGGLADVMYHLAQHGIFDRGLLAWYLGRGTHWEELGWRQRMNRLYVVSELIYLQWEGLSAHNKSVAKLCQRVLDDIKSDPSPEKFVRFSNMLVCLRGMPHVQKQYLAAELLSLHTELEDQLQEFCWTWLDSAWLLYLTRCSAVPAAISDTEDRPVVFMQGFLHSLLYPPGEQSFWSADVRHSIVSMLLRSNVECADKLTCSQICSIAHTMLEVATCYSEPTRMKMVQEVGKIMQLFQRTMACSLRECRPSTLCSLLEVIFALQQLSDAKQLSFTLETSTADVVHNHVNGMFQTGDCVCSPMASLNIYNLLAAVHPMPLLLWQQFETLATGMMSEYLTLLAVVDLGAKFVDQGCISSGFVERVIGLMTDHTLDSFSCHQLLQLSQILLSHQYPSLHHLAEVDVSLLQRLSDADQRYEQLSLSSLAQTLQLYTRRIFIPDKGLVKVYQDFLESAVNKESSKLEMVQYLECLTFFASLCYPSDELGKKGLQCFLDLLPEHQPGLASKPTRSDNALHWMLTLLRCGQTPLGGHLTSIMASQCRQQQESDLTTCSSGDAARLCSLNDLRMHLSLHNPDALKNLLGNPPAECSQIRQVLLQASISNATRYLAPLKALHAQYDTALRRLDGILLRFLKDRNLVDCCVVSESLCPVWRAFYMDTDGYCLPNPTRRIAAGDVLRNHFLCPDVATAVETPAAVSPFSSTEPSPAAETNESSEPVVTAAPSSDSTADDTGQAMMSLLSGVQFGCCKPVGGNRFAVFPLLADAHCAGGSAELLASVRTVQERLEADGWTVITIPLEMMLSGSAVDKTMRVVQKVLAARGKSSHKLLG